MIRRLRSNMQVTHLHSGFYIPRQHQKDESIILSHYNQLWTTTVIGNWSKARQRCIVRIPKGKAKLDPSNSQSFQIASNSYAASALVGHSNKGAPPSCHRMVRTNRFSCYLGFFFFSFFLNNNTLPQKKKKKLRQRKQIILPSVRNQQTDPRLTLILSLLVLKCPQPFNLGSVWMYK